MPPPPYVSREGCSVGTHSSCVCSSLELSLSRCARTCHCNERACVCGIGLTNRRRCEGYDMQSAINDQLTMYVPSYLHSGTASVLSGLLNMVFGNGTSGSPSPTPTPVPSPHCNTAAIPGT